MGFEAETVRNLLKEDIKALKEFCNETPAPEVAEVLSELAPEEILQILRAVDDDSRKVELFTYLPIDAQISLSEILSKKELTTLISNMSHDDRVDLYKKMPEDTKEELTRELAKAEREDIIKLSSYKEGTAGSVMTSDYAMLHPNLTIVEAIEKLRKEAPDKETIYYAYVVDDDRKLIGFVSLKDLIISPSHFKVSDVMETDVVSVRVDDDQEDVARKIEKYDLIAIPVVDDKGILLGIVTHDDAFDIIRQEQTEDVEKLMGITGEHEVGVYLKTPSFIHFKNRITWIIILAFLGIITGMVVHKFENILQQLTILAVYMPMLADTGGNTGSQSATVVIRALALGEITNRDILKVLFKEFKISVMIGCVLTVFVFLRVYMFTPEDKIPHLLPLVNLAVVIALALGIQTVTATLIGALLPLVVAKFKLDPAIIASPALTTIVDMTGLFIYFTMAQFLLKI
jgi:magnesium transporter